MTAATVFTGRRPYTPEDKKCTACGGKLEPDTDGAGNSIDACAKCGKPYQPRSSQAVPSPTARLERTTASAAAGGGRRTKRRRAVKRGRKPGREASTSTSTSTSSADRALSLMQGELAALDKRRDAVLVAIDALTPLSNGNGKNGGPHR